MNWNERLLVYSRRPTREVRVGDPEQGGVVIGGDRPIVKQSMLTAPTLETEACVRQALELVEAGAQLVRLTARTLREAANLRAIAEELRRRGCRVPLVADIHFKPEVAMEAARWVEKIRINPGNFADRKKFQTREYTDEEYAAELARVEAQFAPLVLRCKELGRAMRIGVNHGSLSDRVLNRYGDTTEGMVQSALEFARICRKYDFHDLVFSMKASNPKTVIACCRLLIQRLEEEGAGWNYPIHLGVTEAGEGEDGRLKSAAGIGPLLCEGIGDTVRVSLTENPARELPVCDDLILLSRLLANERPLSAPPLPFDPFGYQRRPSAVFQPKRGEPFGGREPIRVIVSAAHAAALEARPPANRDLQAEAVYEELDALELDPRRPAGALPASRPVTVADGVDLPPPAAFRLLAARLHEVGANNPIILKDILEPLPPDLPERWIKLRAGIVLGALLADGIGDAVFLRGEPDPHKALLLAYNALQAAGARSFKTEYVACPGCGRTLFDLQKVIAQVKERTGHLKGVKIAVMGCIVNGPGEMADADFGYVGGAPGKINLYVGKTPVKFNIPEAEAVDRLVELIQEHGRWIDPPEAG